MTIRSFLTKPLVDWFTAYKRDLPWRKNNDPYAVWISEVMLQQTQVKTVIPYFNKWMESFPTIEDLANAPIEIVIKHWEGLGYYSRARNLHLAAQQIVNDHKGIFPSDETTLSSLKGIGPYTKGAILSFGFHKRSVMIDGNIKRVLARFYGLQENLSTLKGHKVLEALIEEILPHYQPWIFNEALMELGATVCTFKAPECSSCPLRKECYAYQEKAQALLPITNPKKAIMKIDRVVLVLEYQGQFFVKKQTEKLMRDLYEFMHIDLAFKSVEELQEHPELKPYFSQAAEVIELSKQSHTFTHFKVQLKPFFVRLKSPINLLKFETYPLEELFNKAFSSGHKKVLNSLKESKGEFLHYVN